jgi:hypothetical protein
MKFKNIVMWLSGIWMFGFGTRLVWMYFNAPVVFDPTLLENVGNLFIDIIPAFILSLSLIYLGLRDGMHRRPAAQDEARPVRVPAGPHCGSTDKCHPGARAVRASTSHKEGLNKGDTQ